MEKILTTMKQDIVTTLDNIWKSLISSGFEFVINILIALIVIFIGKKIIKVLLGMFEKAFIRGKMEAGVKGFLLAFIRAILYIILTWIILVQIFGVKDASLVAVLGSAGLSIGLALQGGLSNFAGGVIILLLRPFKVGDNITHLGNEGKVISIDIFYTKMLTADNRLVVMPNGALSNANIVNSTNEVKRRLDITVAVDRTEEVERIRNILEDILEKNKYVIKDASNLVFINSFDAGSISMGIRAWVKSEDYFTCKCELLETIKKLFDEKQVKMV